jgi:ammonium transporter, Amt family
MDQQLAELTAKITALEQSAGMQGTIDIEVYYFWATALMILIHAGFLGYEMGASRAKNVLASGIKNILAFAFIVPTFFFFGWWIYLAFPGGFTPTADGDPGLPWAMAMGPNLSDNATGVFWAAFTMFAATTASVFSGAVIERIKMSGFVLLAILLGSVLWILGAAWGWHPNGWLLTDWGFHDFGCAGIVHLIAGAFCLGVLINLGPRIGKYLSDGTAVDIPPHNVPMVLIGLMLIIVGFFGFLAACVIMVKGGQWTNIYGQPMTLSAVGFNTLMAFAGGVIGAWALTRDPFWMMSGGLVGIISAAAGLDVWYPPLAFAIAFFGGASIKIVNDFVVKVLRLDDAVGAVAVHGWGGFVGVMVVGLFATGYANPGEAPPVSFMGQLVGALVCFAIGFVPGFIVSYCLKVVRLLRVPDEAQIIGLDLAEVPLKAYPESDTGVGAAALQPAE